jgi:hypothetical protein
VSIAVLEPPLTRKAARLRGHGRNVARRSDKITDRRAFGPWASPVRAPRGCPLADEAVGPARAAVARSLDRATMAWLLSCGWRRRFRISSQSVEEATTAVRSGCRWPSTAHLCTSGQCGLGQFDGRGVPVRTGVVVWGQDQQHRPGQGHCGRGDERPTLGLVGHPGRQHRA